MKRVWKAAAVVPSEEDATRYEVRLDAKPVRSPGQRPIAVPSRALAEAIAAEWDAQGDTVDPKTMPMTGFAATVADRVSPQRDFVVGELAGFGGSDLLCYRADEPDELVRRQAEGWDPWLAWAEATHGARLTVTAGVMPARQDETALAMLRRAVEAVPDWELAPLHTFVSVTGSLILGLATLAGVLTAERAFALSQIDDAHQAEKWGIDREAEQRRRNLLSDMAQAAKFVELLRA